MTLRPSAAWDRLRAADPPWTVSLLRHALPLSLLPAVAWPLGQMWSGDLRMALATSVVSTIAFTLAAVIVFAAAFYVLSPAFDVPRAWGRCVALAAYASTPVLLAGALLVVPATVVVCVAALIHCCALCYLGAQQVLGCRESEAAFFIAAAAILSVVGSLILGGLCSAAGLI